MGVRGVDRAWCVNSLTAFVVQMEQAGHSSRNTQHASRFTPVFAGSAKVIAIEQIVQLHAHATQFIRSISRALNTAARLFMASGKGERIWLGLI